MNIPADQSTDLRICFLGDSLVNGTGDTRQQGGWVGRLCAAASASGWRLTHYNLGVRGETSSELDWRWFDEVRLRLKPAVDGRLVFAFGTNDCRMIEDRRLLSPEQTVRHARAIFRGAGRRWPTLMVGPPPLLDPAHSARNAALGALLQGVAGECAIPYFDSHAALLDSAAWMGDLAAGDGVHPDAAGYDAWAALLAAWPAWWLHRPPQT